MFERNDDSMLVWWPLVKDVDVPKPKTIVIPIDDKLAFELLNESKEAYENFRNSEGFKKIKEAVIELGLPVFMRTDQTSGKHDWEHTCFLNSLEDNEIISHTKFLVEFSECADIMGLPYNAIVLRQYIRMDNLFINGYHKMPVNPEIRFFVRDGVIECWHWYWIDEAINNPSTPEWKMIMSATKEDVEGHDIFWLKQDAEKVASKLTGYWSIDFCKGKNNTWYLIDLATGEHSWHPKDCKFNKTKDIDLFTGKEITEKDVKVIE